MASIVFLLVVFTICCYSAGNANTAFIAVKCKPENVGQYGQQSLLKCVIQTGQNVADVKIVVVTWKKDRVDKPLLVYNKGESNQQPRYSFAEPSWNDKNMNVSLLINNTVVGDEGSYTCTVMTDSGYGTTQTELKVTAKYSAPTIKLSPETITPNTDVTLTCKSDGGYPEGKIRWFDEHKADWTKSSKMKVMQTKEGLFQLSSMLTLLPGSTFSKYTCAVYSAGEGLEQETMFKMPDQQKNTETVAKYRDSGQDVTLACTSAACSSSPEEYNGMYLYHDFKMQEAVLYYYKITPRKKYNNRIQIDGSLKDHSITIKNLTVDDSGFYSCVYIKRFNAQVRCSIYSLFVRGVAPCSSSDVPLSSVQVSEKSQPLGLIVVATSAISVLVTVIFILLIIPRVKRLTYSRGRTTSILQVSNECVND